MWFVICIVHNELKYKYIYIYRYKFLNTIFHCRNVFTLPLRRLTTTTVLQCYTVVRKTGPLHYCNKLLKQIIKCSANQRENVTEDHVLHWSAVRGAYCSRASRVRVRREYLPQQQTCTVNQHWCRSTCATTIGDAASCQLTSDTCLRTWLIFTPAGICRRHVAMRGAPSEIMLAPLPPWANSCKNVE